jgi:uncharacterized membrane protein YuzA (DUF378 family)
LPKLSRKEVMTMRTPLDRVALVLVIIGALNWLSVGLFRYDLVASIFGTASLLTRTIFTIVGIAGLYSISLLFRETETARNQ